MLKNPWESPPYAQTFIIRGNYRLLSTHRRGTSDLILTKESLAALEVLREAPIPQTRPQLKSYSSLLSPPTSLHPT
jgi:hypothetical protein